MTADQSRIAKLYAAFAQEEARGRSPLYVELCNGVARDEAMLAYIAALPPPKQQPNLLLAAVKYLCGTADSYAHFRALFDAHQGEVTNIILTRRTQTNEPRRCALLLPVLASLPQPLALLEVGASAGLCLHPDRYAYDYGGHIVRAAAPVTPSPPVFACKPNARVPLPGFGPEVVWRAGLEIEPIDAGDEAQTRWLEALIWPGEGTRTADLHAALEVARAAPPRIVQGDLRHDLRALAAEAPRDATLVIFHTWVLAYVRELSERRAFAEQARALGARWIACEGPGVFPEIVAPLRRPWPAQRSLLSLDGRAVAWAEPHGTALDWL